MYYATRSRSKVDSPPPPPPAGKTGKRKMVPEGSSKMKRQKKMCFSKKMTVSGSISPAMRKKMFDEGLYRGMTKKQIIIEMAEKVNEPVSWYIPRTEAMEALVKVLKLPTDDKAAVASEDDQFFIEFLAGQTLLMVKSMDEVQALVYLKDNYRWCGLAYLQEHDGVMCLKDALAENGIDCIILPADCVLF